MPNLSRAADREPSLSIVAEGPRGPRDEWRPSGRAERQEFFLPVSGFVWFYPEEVNVIDHPAFQRLSKIYQLGQAHLVFRGATHKRIEHVLGAVGVVQRMINAVSITAEKAAAKGEVDRRARLSRPEERFVRLAALLHDIGHLASGHTLEDELGLFGKHDEDERLDLIFSEVDWKTGRQVERLASVIDRNYANYVPDDLRTAGVTPTEIVRLLIRKKPTINGVYAVSKDKYKKQQAALEKSSSIRLNVCINMVGNTLCADLLDYIYRDWYHVGKVIQPEDRIFQYMEIRNREAISAPESAPENQRRSPSDLFVLNLGDNTGQVPKIRTDGISAVLSLLERRYELAETVLYHRTKLAAGAMLGRALHELWGGSDAKDMPKTLLHLSDEQLVDYALAHAESAVTSGDEETKDRADAARYLLTRLRSRSLYRAFRTVRRWDDDLAAGQKDRLTERFAPKDDATGLGAANRSAAARSLEQDLELPKGSIVISLSVVNPKIAEVEISVNKKVTTFAAYEAREEAAEKRGLSGGHLQAQINRFSDLWRCDFFLSKEVLAHLQQEAPHKLQLLRAIIKELFVSPASDPEDLAGSVERLAHSYVLKERATGRNNIQTRSQPPKLLAARGVEDILGEGDAPAGYPGGAPALRSYWSVNGQK